MVSVLMKQLHSNIKLHLYNQACFSKQAGFTYIYALLLTLVLAVTSAAAASLWQVESRRQAEAELIFIGREYQDAIGAYYIRNRKFPMSLQELLGSADVSGNKVRYLRKIYRDPITGKKDWGFVQANNAGIAGVYSFSATAPIKVANFSDREKKFEGADKYSDWKFIYIPRYIPTNADGIAFPMPRP